jgi:predicted peroxiredoxin
MKKILLFTWSMIMMFTSFNVYAVSGLSKDKVTNVKLSDFKKKAPELVDKTIVLKGIVDHVCEHGGKKMFLVDENSDARVKIVPNEELAAFKQDMVGETVEVTGIVKEFRLDEDYLIEMEEKVKADSKEESEIHMGDGEHKGNKEEHSIEDQLKQIENLRKKLKDSGKDHLSYYSVEAISYKVIK